MCTICGFVGSYKNRSHHVKTHSNEVRPKEVKVPCSQCFKPICKSNMSRHLRKCSTQMEAIRYILLFHFTLSSCLFFSSETLPNSLSAIDFNSLGFEFLLVKTCIIICIESSISEDLNHYCPLLYM